MTTQKNVSANTELPFVIKPLSVKDVRGIFDCCESTAKSRRMKVAKALDKQPNMVTRKDILEYYKLK